MGNIGHVVIFSGYKESAATTAPFRLSFRSLLMAKTEISVVSFKFPYALLVDKGVSIMKIIGPIVDLFVSYFIVECLLLVW